MVGQGVGDVYGGWRMRLETISCFQRGDLGHGVGSAVRGACSSTVRAGNS